MPELNIIQALFLLVLGVLLSVAGGVLGGYLIAPEDNKSISAMMGGALASAGVIPGLFIGLLIVVFL